MDSKFLKAVEVVLAHEGGYVNNPNDPGGETKFGISKRSYPSLDIKNLTKQQAIDIYYRDWWVKYRYREIADVDLATKVFDLSVNMGPSQGHKILQRAINFVEDGNLEVDGIIGPKTIAAANSADVEKVLQTMRFMAAEYYYLLAKRRKEFRSFLMGWLNRAHY